MRSNLFVFFPRHAVSLAISGIVFTAFHRYYLPFRDGLKRPCAFKDNLLPQLSEHHGLLEVSERQCIADEVPCIGEIGVIRPVSFSDIIGFVIGQECVS